MMDFELNGLDLNNVEKLKIDLDVNFLRLECYFFNDGMYSLFVGVDKLLNNKKIGNCFFCVGGIK